MTFGLTGSEKPSIYLSINWHVARWPSGFGLVVHWSQNVRKWLLSNNHTTLYTLRVNKSNNSSVHTQKYTVAQRILIKLHPKTIGCSGTYPTKLKSQWT